MGTRDVLNRCILPLSLIGQVYNRVRFQLNDKGEKKKTVGNVYTQKVDIKLVETGSFFYLFF